jgi:16S rRNA C1402 N4-methylase RsmH
MLDLTFGLGGHSLAMLKQDDNLEVIGLELDKRILDYFHK